MTTPTTGNVTAKTAKPRVNRTPAQKAKDALDAAQKRYDRARTSSNVLKRASMDAEQAYQDSIAEQSAASDALDWAKKNPDLPKTSQAERAPVTQTSGVS